jgi:FSR family fosmidomycin resistance protein-like MFS transporter
VAPFGLAGMPIMAVTALPGVVLMFMYMNDALPSLPPQPVRAAGAAASRNHGAAAIVVTAFVLFIMLRSGTSQGFATLLPKYFSDLGYPPAQFGFMLGIFSFAGAVGTLAGGYLGERFNWRTIMVVASIAAAPFAFMMLYTTGPAYIIAAVGAGLFLSMPHSIILVMAQELAPHRRGLVGGLVLGFMFASGSTMAWFEAIAADRFGLQLVLSIVAFFPAAAGLIAVFLPARRPEQPMQPAIVQPTAASAAD